VEERGFYNEKRFSKKAKMEIIRDRSQKSPFFRFDFFKRVIKISIKS